MAVTVTADALMEENTGIAYTSIVIANMAQQNSKVIASSIPDGRVCAFIASTTDFSKTKLNTAQKGTRISQRSLVQHHPSQTSDWQQPNRCRDNRAGITHLEHEPKNRK
jgi:hypothetical protein